MRPEDLALVTVPEQPEHCTATCWSSPWPVPIRRPNEYRGGLFRIPLDGGDAAAVELGTDGHVAACCRRTAGGWRSCGPPAMTDGAPQLHVMPSDGGDARWSRPCRSACRRRCGRPTRRGSLSPQGFPSPAATARGPRVVRHARPGRRGPPPDHADGLRRGQRRLPVRPAQQAVRASTRPCRTPNPTELTDGTCDVADPAWTPDGEHLIVVARRDLGVTETLHDDLYTVPAAGGDLTLLARTAGFAMQPTVDRATARCCTSAPRTAVSARSEANNHGLWAVPVPAGSRDAAPADRRRRPSTPSRWPGGPAVLGDDVLVGGAEPGCRRTAAGCRCRRDNAPLDDLPVLLGDRALVKAFTVAGDRDRRHRVHSGQSR